VRPKLRPEAERGEHRHRHQLALEDREEGAAEHLAVGVAEGEAREVGVEALQAVRDGCGVRAVDAFEEQPATPRERLGPKVGLAGRRRHLSVEGLGQGGKRVDGARIAREQKDLQGRLLQVGRCHPVLEGRAVEPAQVVAPPDRRRRGDPGQVPDSDRVHGARW